MVYVFCVLAIFATGDSATAGVLERPTALQEANNKVNNWGRNFRVGKNGVVTHKQNYGKKSKPKTHKQKGGAIPFETARGGKVKMPKNSAYQIDGIDPDLLNRSYGPVR
ncbi:MAG: hypothetical protein AAF495_03740 [Pseudomonadota bacterium]